ncbi:MAG: hypothetical protein O0W85_00710, partial [Methanocorpusculum sp.]|nr:hypothetical protein [Methanocorpusculum sp.]
SAEDSISCYLPIGNKNTSYKPSKTKITEYPKKSQNLLPLLPQKQYSVQKQNKKPEQNVKSSVTKTKTFQKHF